MSYFIDKLLSGGGGGGSGRGLGPRNDVLTTCKAVNLRASQRFQGGGLFSHDFNFGFERWVISIEFRILSPPAK